MRIPVLFLLAACHPQNDDLLHDYEGDTVSAVKDYVKAELRALNSASADLCAAAPAPDADGWSSSADAAAVQASKDAWTETRTRYEHVEGAIAVLFPDLDISTDQRYDGFVSANGPDDDLFDDQNVTGVHAIERILWSDEIPDYVVTFESGIPGYEPAAFPSDQTEATEYHDLLCQRLVDDTQSMSDQFEPLALDPAAAYGGVVGSMREQVEKLSLARTGEEESRYAQHTAADMRANLEGGEAIYASFRKWIQSEDGGKDADAAVQAGFARVDAALAEVEGDAIPEVPEDWNPDAPTPDDLATPYGKLWNVIHVESDPENPDGLVTAMVDAAAKVEIAVAP